MRMNFLNVFLFDKPTDVSLRTHKISIVSYRARIFDENQNQTDGLQLRSTTLPDKRHSSHSRQAFRKYLVQQVNQV
jgi:hypothetical protein